MARSEGTRWPLPRPHRGSSSPGAPGSAGWVLGERAPCREALINSLPLLLSLTPLLTSEGRTETQKMVTSSLLTSN